MTKQPIEDARTPESAALPQRDIPALIEALRIRAMALTGEAWERSATRDMMKEAAQRLEDCQTEIRRLRDEHAHRHATQSHATCHDVVCNGDRAYAVGHGHGCSCRGRSDRLMAENNRLTADLAETQQHRGRLLGQAAEVSLLLGSVLGEGGSVQDGIRELIKRLTETQQQRDDLIAELRSEHDHLRILPEDIHNASERRAYENGKAFAFRYVADRLTGFAGGLPPPETETQDQT